MSTRKTPKKPDAVVEIPEVPPPPIAKPLRLIEIARPPRPLHRSTQTVAMIETDDIITIETIVTHNGGGMDADSPVPPQWEQLPESGQADWQGYSVGEWEVHWRIIQGWL
jgi:hypothetical protein